MLDLKFPEPSPSGLDCGLFCFFRLTDHTCSVALRARGNTDPPPNSLFILELEQLGEDSLHPYGNGNGNSIKQNQDFPDTPFEDISIFKDVYEKGLVPY